MEKWGFIPLITSLWLLVLLVLPTLCTASIQLYGRLSPGFQASQMGYIDNDGLFLLSNDASFAFGFKPTQDVTLFLLVIIHQETSTVIWTANRGNPVANSDNFVFDSKGSVTLQARRKVVWSPETDGKSVSSIQLENSGNLVFQGSDNTTVWQTFSHPTNTLVSTQNFTQGMKLSSDPDVRNGNLTYFLEIKSGDLNLYAGYRTPQVYWSMTKDTRKIINKDGGEVSLVKIEANSWRFYDQNKVLLWQFIFLSNPNPGNSTWMAVLGNDGFITFYSLGVGSSKVSSSVKIPSDPCTTPEPCEAYEACSSNKCQCPSGLLSRSCQTGISSPCGATNSSLQLIYAGDGLSYFALGFVQPSSKTTLDGCKNSCASNCSCLAVFFDNSSRSCYRFDRIGSFLSDSTSKYSAYVKVSMIGNGEVGGDSSNGNHLAVIIVIVIVTLLIIVMMEQGKLEEILDSSLTYKPYDESVQNAIKVALWCIQEDTSIRPSMTKVVQMLEGLCPVPHPPMTSFSGSRLFSTFFKSMSEEGTATGTSSGPSDCNSYAYMSAERLSGPR
ncbi:hypothetical protein Cgig2_008338 [Carnegiea gigantea]|uniref:Bulb-type lectin domain-containing protein n=1 Tax=Carnegiea gigantea TaxID=171969 RepID=A0A9Q1QD32_9CARY|nr:hypothetical protein Cgig2_008338 [Carnegiea gigantea]